MKKECNNSKYKRPMKRLETTFAGLTLRNPFVVSSSNLTDSPEKNKKWEDAGVGAVVLKSLFEEEIEAESGWMQEGTHVEEQDYLFAYYRAHRLEEYLNLVRQTKAVCTIPVIASINCFRLTEWTEFAKQIEQAGADALELNVMSVSTGINEEYGAFEQLHVEILVQIKQMVSIPVIVKLGKNLSNPLRLVHQLYAHGASGVVLFNRMVNTDIDLDKKVYAMGEVFSNPSDLYDSLRWVGLASHHVPKLAYAVSGGVNDGAAMVKAIMAGASAVEVCSALYRDKAEVVQRMLAFLNNWMESNQYEKISDFKGMMNAGQTGGGSAFERTQFFKHFGRYK